MKFKFKIEGYPPILIVGGAVFLILLLDILILMRPQLVLLGRTTRKANTISRELKTARRDIKAIESFRKRLEVLMGKDSIAGAAFLKEEEMPVALDKISRLAKQNNVKIIQMKPVKEDERKVANIQSTAVYELPIQIEASCGYHQLGKYINALEQENIFMNVAALEIVSNPSDSFHHKVSMIVLAYILKNV